MRKTWLLSFVLVLAVAAQPAVSQTAAPAPTPDVMVPTSQLPGPEVLATLDGMLYDYAVFDLDPATIHEQVRSTGRLNLYLNNQGFDLILEPNDLRGESYREVILDADREIELAPRTLPTYKGHVAGDPDSIVRFSILPDRFEGYVKTDQEWVFVDSLDRYTPTARADRVVVYRNDDVRPGAAGECGAGHMLDQIEGLQARLGQVPLTDGSHVRRTLEVATDGDGQLFNRYGNPGVFNFMADVLNRVDGIYRNQLNIAVVISFQQAWSSISGDPYTSLSASTTLNQLRDWWNANRSGTNRDTVHQFSGKDFNGGTAGIAFTGVVCNAPSFAYGVSQDQRNSAINQRLTAHELGHNLSAAHDDQIGCANCNGFGPIMCSFLQSNGSNTFSSCSRNDIGNHVHSNGFCM